MLVSDPKGDSSRDSGKRWQPPIENGTKDEPVDLAFKPELGRRLCMMI